jgi:hypothetical protein
MGIDLTTFRAAFFEMEEAEDLFSLRMEDGTYYWDLVRPNVLYGLHCAYGGPFNNPVSIQKASLVSKSKDVVKALLNEATIDYLVARRPRYLFYTVQRTRVGSQVVDTTSDPLFDLVADKSIAIETSNKKSVSLLAMLLHRQTRIPPVYIHTTPSGENLERVCAELAAKLQRHFARSVDVQNLISEPVAVYRQYRKYFLSVFSRHKPKAIVVINNGIPKGLFSAAREMLVPTLELQHGAPSLDSPYWSYPRSVSSSNPGLTLPDVYLTYSEYWRQATHYPVKATVTVGNDYLYQVPVTSSGSSVAILSAYMYQEELAPLAVELASAFPTRTIYFKLHPHQFSQKAAIAEEFCTRPNVVVLSDEMDLSTLFTECTFVIGVNSTLLYSALQARKKVMIYKRANYFWHNDIFEFVELFDNASEAAGIINTHEVRFTALSRAPVFFAPLDRVAFMSALDSARASVTPSRTAPAPQQLTAS